MNLIIYTPNHRCIARATHRDSHTHQASHYLARMPINHAPRITTSTYTPAVLLRLPSHRWNQTSPRRVTVTILTANNTRRSPIWRSGHHPAHHGKRRTFDVALLRFIPHCYQSQVWSRSFTKPPLSPQLLTCVLTYQNHDDFHKLPPHRCSIFPAAAQLTSRTDIPLKRHVRHQQTPQTVSRITHLH